MHTSYIILNDIKVHLLFMNMRAQVWRLIIKFYENLKVDFKRGLKALKSWDDIKGFKKKIKLIIDDLLSLLLGFVRDQEFLQIFDHFQTLENVHSSLSAYWGCEISAEDSFKGLLHIVVIFKLNWWSFEDFGRGFDHVFEGLSTTDPKY